MKSDQQVDLLESLLNQMTRGILYIDHNGIITVANPAAADLLGKERDELLGRHYAKIFEENFFGFSLNGVLEGIDNPLVTDISFQSKTLEIEPTQVAEDGKFGLIILIRNVSHLRRLENVASRKNRLEDLGELASVIGYELRNPLGGIKGFASLLARELEQDPKLKPLADNIVKGTNDLNEILTKLLDYSHPHPLKMSEEDIPNLIREVITLMESDEAVKAKSTIIYEGPPEGVKAEVDAASIRSVLMNLILNASQAFKEKGTITVRLQEKNDDIQIEVQDDGPGIPPDIFKKIFRPFFSTKTGGSGFGLAESRRIIDSHHGTITVDSTPGQGATFTFTIPRKHEG